MKFSMRMDKKYRLTIRQLNDIIAQADQIQSTRNFKQQIREFSRFSNELKEYMLNNFDNKELKEILKTIPTIDLKYYQRRYWYHYLIFPWYFSIMYNELRIKEDIVPLVMEVKKKYRIICERLLDHPQITVD